MIQLIFRPLDYIKITWQATKGNGKKYNAKKWIDIYLPIFSALFSSFFMLLLFLSNDFKIFFKGDAFGLLTNFLQTLPGFYIAALAAIVSFNNPKLDEIDFDDCPIDCNSYNMTFRRFLANTFSYLAWISIFLIFYCLAVKYIFESIQVDIIDLYFYFVYVVLLLPLIFFITQLFSITAMSLFYLGDRIHRS